MRTLDVRAGAADPNGLSLRPPPERFSKREDLILGLPVDEAAVRVAQLKALSGRCVYVLHATVLSDGFH